MKKKFEFPDKAYHILFGIHADHHFILYHILGNTDDFRP